MTKEEIIQVLQSIEDRAIEFPNMTECDWVAIAAAKKHLTNTLEVKEVDLEKENLPISNSLTEEGLFTFEDGSQAIITRIN